LETAWHLLTTGALYEDPGADHFERRHDPAVEAKRLGRRIEALGFAVTITEKAASPDPSHSFSSSTRRPVPRVARPSAAADGAFHPTRGTTPSCPAEGVQRSRPPRTLRVSAYHDGVETQPGEGDAARDWRGCERKVTTLSGTPLP
jgi:hypothetical protein